MADTYVTAASQSAGSAAEQAADYRKSQTHTPFTRYNQLSYRFDNRLDRVNGASEVP